MVFLMSKTTPEYEYLKLHTDISTPDDLVPVLRQRVQELDLAILAKDIEPFLFDPSQKDRVLYFKEWIDSL